MKIKKFENINELNFNVGDYVLYNFSKTNSDYYYILKILDIDNEDKIMTIEPSEIILNDELQKDKRNIMRFNMNNKDILFNSNDINKVRDFYKLHSKSKKYNI